MKEIISFTMGPDLRKEIDRQRGDIPRSRFIIRILETYISRQKEIALNKSLLPVDYKPGNFQSTGMDY